MIRDIRQRPMQTKQCAAVWIVVALALIGCLMCSCTAPPAAVEYKTVTPQLPPALLAQQPAPAVPVCTTDNCVAGYIVDLHTWAVTGWAHLGAVSAALAPSPK